MSLLPRPHVLVPLNMLSALLKAVSDPSVTENTAIDPILLVKELPSNQSIPHVGQSLSRVAGAKARYKALMETLMRVLNGDLGELQRKCHRIRSRAIRVDSTARYCYYCSEFCQGTDIVVFDCSHTFHPKCVVTYLLENGSLKPENGNFDDPVAFVLDPGSVLKTRPKKIVPYCRNCPSLDEEVL